MFVDPEGVGLEGLRWKVNVLLYGENLLKQICRPSSVTGHQPILNMLLVRWFQNCLLIIISSFIQWTVLIYWFHQMLVHFVPHFHLHVHISYYFCFFRAINLMWNCFPINVQQLWRNEKVLQWKTGYFYTLYTHEMKIHILQACFMVFLSV